MESNQVHRFYKNRVLPVNYGSMDKLYQYEPKVSKEGKVPTGKHHRKNEYHKYHGLILDL